MGVSQTAQTENAVNYILRKFNELYAPYKSVIQATAFFNAMIQKPGQCVDEFVTDLKLQAQKCNYGPRENRLIGDRIVIGIRDTALRERLLREQDLTLRKIISTCKAAELSKKHLRDIQKTEDEVRVDGLYHQPANLRAPQPGYQHPASQREQVNN